MTWIDVLAGKPLPAERRISARSTNGSKCDGRQRAGQFDVEREHQRDGLLRQALDNQRQRNSNRRAVDDELHGQLRNERNEILLRRLGV